MTSTCFKRFLFAALLTAFCLSSSSAQVFWTQTFASPDVTVDWSNGGTNTGPQIWHWTDDPTAATFGTPAFAAPSASDGFFLFNSDANGAMNTHDITLTGPSINCEASASTRITFFTQYSYYQNNTAFLEVSVDGGLSWTSHLLFQGVVAETMFHAPISMDLPEANGQMDVRLRFRWTGAWEYSWKIDDISLENVVDHSFCTLNADAVLCDNLDAYDAALLLGPQSAWWTTWFGAEGGGNDATVSMEESYSAPNSIKIVSTSPGGGLQSAILQMGGLDSGNYELKFKLFLPAGKTAYYDLRQAIPIVFGGNNLNVSFDSSGVGVLRSSSSAALDTFEFPHATWFECKHRFNLNANTEEFWIDDILLATTPFTGVLGGVLFMGGNAISVFYIDDVALTPYELETLTLDDCEGAAALDTLLGGPVGEARVSGLFDNSEATADPTDPEAPACFLDGVPDVVSTIDGSLWFTFTGDGNKYHLETVPCNAGVYITDGDTQMAVFSGECGDFTELVCNEDLEGAEDYRAGLDLETVPGVNYHLLVDGWSDPATGYVATGEFCIQATRMLTITCAEAMVGSYSISQNYVCPNTTTGSLFDLNEGTFVLPTSGAVHGMTWAITTEPVPMDMWPPAMPSYWGSFSISSELYTPNLSNDGILSQDSTWYFTPVIIANAIDIEPGTPAYLHDISDACYYIGESVGLFLFDELETLSAVPNVTQPITGNDDGAIDLNISGGAYDVLQNAELSYSVQWTGPDGFNATLEDISGLSPGTYVAVITDLHGCVAPLDITVQLTAVTGTKDPAGVQSLLVSPNPASTETMIQLVLENTSDVRLEVLNQIGQTLEIMQPGRVQIWNQTLDLSRYVPGIYFLRLRLDGETAVRRVVVR